VNAAGVLPFENPKDSDIAVAQNVRPERMPPLLSLFRVGDVFGKRQGQETDEAEATFKQERLDVSFQCERGFPSVPVRFCWVSGAVVTI
jgi:hypothetical protein